MTWFFFIACFSASFSFLAASSFTFNLVNLLRSTLTSLPTLRSRLSVFFSSGSSGSLSLSSNSSSGELSRPKCASLARLDPSKEPPPYVHNRWQNYLGNNLSLSLSRASGCCSSVWHYLVQSVISVITVMVHLVVVIIVLVVVSIANTNMRSVSAGSRVALLTQASIVDRR